MELNKLSKISKNKSKRVGRGYGSGKGGHTVGRGSKGQRSRAGFGKVKAWIRESKLNSVPKLRGIGKRTTKKTAKNVKKVVINLDRFKDTQENTKITKDFLVQNKIISNKFIDVKILGTGTIDKPLVFIGFEVSKKALEKIKSQGGKVIIK